MNKTTLTKYVWELKQKHNITPTLKWYMVKSVPSYSTRWPIEQRSELVSKCRHVKYLWTNNKANDQHSVEYLSNNSIV